MGADGIIPLMPALLPSIVQMGIAITTTDFVRSLLRSSTSIHKEAKDFYSRGAYLQGECREIKTDRLKTTEFVSKKFNSFAISIVFMA